jgi:hypothetical protein
MKYAALLMLFTAGPLMAGCVTPLDYTGDVDQAAQQVLVLHRARKGDTTGYQEMIIRVQPFFQGAEAFPAELAWVITVPGKPERYDTCDSGVLLAATGLHDRLFGLAQAQWANRTEFGWPDWLPPKLLSRSADSFATTDGTVAEGQLVKVGPYTITPLRARGAEAVTALNAYLKERGFPQEDPGHLQYFIDNDFTFLCVRVMPPAGDATLGRALDLPPLVVGFETDRPYYPGLFSSRQGDFALDLTIVSDKPLDTESIFSASAKLNAASQGFVQLVNLFTMRTLPGDLAAGFSERARADDPSRWYINRLRSKGFNPTVNGKPAIAGWEEDVFFKVGDTTDELPGFWYYGDQEIGWFDRFFREHALALFTSIGVVFFGSLFIKTRINRRRLMSQTPPK